MGECERVVDVTERRGAFVRCRIIRFLSRVARRPPERAQCFTSMKDWPFAQSFPENGRLFSTCPVRKGLTGTMTTEGHTTFFSINLRDRRTTRSPPSSMHPVGVDPTNMATRGTEDFYFPINPQELFATRRLGDSKYPPIPIPETADHGVVIVSETRMLGG